jgi:predicted RNA-binding protein
MCLSTAYVTDGNERREIMKDVARIEADQGGVWLIDFFGKKLFVEAAIQTVDLVDEHFVALKILKEGK